MEIPAGTKAYITRDIIVENQYAFRQGETVTVEKVVPNLERPDYKYVVFSWLLQKKFQLKESHLFFYQQQIQSGSQPAPFLKPRERIAVRTRRKRVLTRKKIATLVSCVLILLLAASGITSFVLLNPGDIRFGDRRVSGAAIGGLRIVESNGVYFLCGKASVKKSGNICIQLKYDGKDKKKAVILALDVKEGGPNRIRKRLAFKSRPEGCEIAGLFFVSDEATGSMASLIDQALKIKTDFGSLNQAIVQLLVAIPDPSDRTALLVTSQRASELAVQVEYLKDKVSALSLPAELTQLKELTNGGLDYLDEGISSYAQVLGSLSGLQVSTASQGKISRTLDVSEKYLAEALRILKIVDGS